VGRFLIDAVGMERAGLCRPACVKRWSRPAPPRQSLCPMPWPDFFKPCASYSQRRFRSFVIFNSLPTPSPNMPIPPTGDSPLEITSPNADAVLGSHASILSNRNLVFAPFPRTMRTADHASRFTFHASRHSASKPPLAAGPGRGTMCPSVWPPPRSTASTPSHPPGANYAPGRHRAGTKDTPRMQERCKFALLILY
jgi:hypothetical protein